VTFEQHAQRIRQLEFELEKAQYGMGMPYDAERVRDLCKAIDDACEAYTAYMKVAS